MKKLLFMVVLLLTSCTSNETEKEKYVYQVSLNDDAKLWAACFKITHHECGPTLEDCTIMQANEEIGHGGTVYCANNVLEERLNEK